MAPKKVTEQNHRRRICKYAAFDVGAFRSESAYASALLVLRRLDGAFLLPIDALATLAIDIGGAPQSVRRETLRRISAGIAVSPSTLAKADRQLRFWAVQALFELRKELSIAQLLLATSQERSS